jgi:argininosuccinate lyase
MSRLMLENIRIKEDILKDEKYQYLFSVEVVNRLVLEGTPFREAYKQVGHDIENGVFKPDTNIQHTHEGSIGNLCTAEIKAQMEAVIKQFPFEKVHKAIEALVK